MRQFKPIFLVLLAAAIPVVGYGIMHLVVYVFPLTRDSTGTQLLVTLLIIALGLAVPYWMLKASFSKAATNDWHEKELHMKDIPKDGEQIARE